MKKIYLLCSTLFLAGSVFAQLNQSVITDHESSKQPATAHEIAQSRLAGQQNLAMPKHERGDQFFCEDFANGFDGNNPYGAWTFEDSGNNQIWMEANANSPGGEFSTNIDPLDSPTADNGWVIFDCDLYNTPISDGFEDVTGFLYAPELNCGSLSSVIVEYYQYFRYCCFSASPLTLEVSTDGGSNWTVFPAQGSFFPSANTLSANPLYTVVDISCAAAGEENVLIRWAYNSAPNTGYSHYFWGIDDVCIYENPVMNDLEIVQVTNGDIFNIWEYRITPLEQAITAADGGMLAGAIFRNNGNTDQSNVEITIEIMDDAMNVLSTTVTDPFDMPAFANTPECPSILLDTLFIPTGWEPTEVGTYFVRASISSDATDEVTDNDFKEREIEYTTDIYGHDGPADFDLEIRPRESDNGGGLFDPTGYGNFFTCPNDGSTAYGLTAVFGENSDEGIEFLAALYSVVEGLDNEDYVTGDEYAYDPNWFTGDPYYLPFEDPYDLQTDEVYFTCILNENESDGEITVLANANTDSDNSTAVYEIAGDGSFVWFSSQTWTPAVRLIISDWVGVEEVDPTTGLNSFMINPNPATDLARLNFNLNQNGVIAYEVRDMSGKLVDWKNVGRFVEGNQVIELNVAGYAAGNYNVSLVVNGAHMVTRQMSVVK